MFLILLNSIDCGYSLEPPRRGGSNEYHNLCFEQKYEKYRGFYLKIFEFLEVKSSICLNRHVFVMTSKMCCHVTLTRLYYEPYEMEMGLMLV